MPAFTPAKVRCSGSLEHCGQPIVGPVMKVRIPDAAFPAVADGQHAVVGGHGNAVRERTAVHNPAQNTVVRILIDGTRAVSRAWAGTGSPGIGEEQIAFGIEVEIVGAFEQLVTVGVNQGADPLRLRVVDQNAAVPRREVEFAVVPPCTLRLTGLTEISLGIAIEYRDQLSVRECRSRR